jgi:uridine kinase
MSGIQPEVANRFVVSICGGSGTGKSTLSKLICEKVGDNWSTRIPADYYLKSNKFSSVDEFFNHPLEYEWELIEQALKANNGQNLSTPNFDFIYFKRITIDGGRSYVMRPLVFIDAMLPYPKSNFTVFLDAPDNERRKRIIERDKIWNTQVILNWKLHQRTLYFLKNHNYVFDCVLDAMQPVDENVGCVISILQKRFLFSLLSKNSEK